MTALRSLALAGCITACAVSLTGCSVDTLLWGRDGGRIIETTENLIDDVAADATSELLCEGAEPDLGTTNDWEGRSAGEPERFAAELWVEQAPFEPQWSINLEGLPDGAKPGDTFPGDVFYRETETGFCVIDVAWSRLAYSG